jgi:hypothetical protein
LAGAAAATGGSSDGSSGFGFAPAPAAVRDATPSAGAAVCLMDREMGQFECVAEAGSSGSHVRGYTARASVVSICSVIDHA